MSEQEPRTRNRRYIYGMRDRGAIPGAEYPKDGFIDAEEDPLDDYRSILVYSRMLSREDCEQYGLDFLGIRIR